MLDQAAIDAWDAYASTLTRLNKLGEEYTPKGRQIYMEVNQNLQQYAVGAMIAAPGPTTESPAIITPADIVVSETAGVIDTLTLENLTGDFPGGATANTNILVVEASPVHDPKLTNVNTQFRQVFVETLANQTNITVANYTDVFGDAGLEDQIIDFRYWVIDLITGLASPQIKTSIAIAET